MENTDRQLSIESLKDMALPCTSFSEVPPPPPSNTKTARPVRSAKGKALQKPAPAPQFYDLKGVVNLLILVGMTSVNIWEKVIFDVKKKVSDLMNIELTTLYFNLKMVSSSICTGISTNADLSQEKLELINEVDRDYNEIMEYASPALQVFSQNRYSVEVVKMFKELVQDIIVKMNSIEISDDEEKSKPGSKKRKSAQQNDDNDEEEDDDGNDDEDELFRLFGKKCSSKNKSKKLAISQQVTTKNDEVTRKCITPGETGKYLMKIEITDCDDLKGIKPAQYWTKVWKKAVFLVGDDKDPAFIALNNVWMNQAKRLLQMKDVKVTEIEEHDDSDTRKRARFFR